MQIDVNVWGGGYPVWVELTIDGTLVKVRHSQLLELEHAIALAKQKALKELPRKDWHEVDPAYISKV